MSGTTWSKFFWSDWQYEPALRLCSYAARGLWMDMLCIAAAHDPIGYVAVAGRGLGETDIARMTGGSESEVSSLLGELDRNGVFSRDRHGRIYSRRMISDAKKAAEARKNGKNGGNPNLRKGAGNPTSVNPRDKGGDKPQKPEARSQELFEDADASSVGSVEQISVGSTKAQPWLGDADFMAAWEACTDQGRARSSRKQAWGTWKAHTATPSEKRAALTSYLDRDPDVKRTGGPGFHLWLRDKLDEWLDAQPRPTAPAMSWAGPADVLTAVQHHQPVDWAVFHLSKCRWDAETRTLTGPVASVLMLKQEAGSSLAGIGVKIAAEDGRAA